MNFNAKCYVIWEKKHCFLFTVDSDTWTLILHQLNAALPVIVYNAQRGMHQSLETIHSESTLKHTKSERSQRKARSVGMGWGG